MAALGTDREDLPSNEFTEHELFESKRTAIATKVLSPRHCAP